MYNVHIGMHISVLQTSMQSRKRGPSAPHGSRKRAKPHMPAKQTEAFHRGSLNAWMLGCLDAWMDPSPSFCGVDRWSVSTLYLIIQFSPCWIICLGMYLYHSHVKKPATPSIDDWWSSVDLLIFLSCSYMHCCDIFSSFNFILASNWFL